nr:IS982 family transposase [Leekyejoonella antrihumi]
MDADLDTLATALYATADDLLTIHPERVPARPVIGFTPRICDAEMLTLAVLQALLGFTSEARWIRHAQTHLGHLFPYVPQQSGYNKRLRKLADAMAWLTAQLGGLSSIGTDDTWVVDSTPVECGRSRETAKRSDLAGWAEYGYCASHSRFFWGLRLHLVCTLHGLPVGWVLTGAKADEREAFWAIAESTPAIADMLTAGHSQVMIADKNYFGRLFETELANAGITLLRPARKGEQPRPRGLDMVGSFMSCQAGL